MSSTLPKKHKLLDKRMPTLIGVGILVIGLVAGTILFSRGTGVFAPRATPETEPKNVKITNVTEKSFSVSFATDEASVGFIKYGTNPDSLKTQAGDDRDQLYGTVEQYPLHHITASGLEESTTYYFVIGTGSKVLYDNAGNPFQVTTAKKGSAPPVAKTIYGAVTNTQGSPAEGSIVYATLEGAGPLSQLVQKTGSWAIALSNARSLDGKSYAEISDATPLLLQAQGSPLSETSTVQTSVGEYTNGSTIALGANPENGGLQVAGGEGAAPAGLPPVEDPTPTPTLPEEPTIKPPEDATPSASDADTLTPTPTPSKAAASGQIAGLLGSSGGEDSVASGSGDAMSDTPDAIIDLDATESSTITDTTPVIQGTAPPNVVVVVRVHSDSNIEERVTAAADGSFSLDLEALSQTLEPGQHTVEYSYVDPDTGEVITKTHTFTVEAPAASQQLAYVAPTATPAYQTSPTPAAYGTDYPYGTSPSPSPSPTLVASGSGSTATPSATPTYSASGSGVSTPAAQVTNSGTLMNSGSIGTTLALLMGGFLFILAGGWSFWVAKELGAESQ